MKPYESEQKILFSGFQDYIKTKCKGNGYL